MDKNDNLSENISTSQDKRKQKTESVGYLNFIELMNSEKRESEKIKAMIMIEDIDWLYDKNTNAIKLHRVYTLFEKHLNESENSNLLKGQILITATNIIILINAKDDYYILFLNFINNILIENIKKVNTYHNIYLRQISCHCLEELETQYPGLLFSLMGSKTLDLINQSQNISDDLSVSSSKISHKTKMTEIPVYDKKIELESKLLV